MKNMVRTLVKGSVLTLVAAQAVFPGGLADASAQMLGQECIPLYRDAGLSFRALGRSLNGDPSIQHTRMVDYSPPEEDPVAVMVQALRDGTNERFVTFADDRASDHSGMFEAIFHEHSALQAVPVAEPSTLILLGSAIIGLATTMRRHGKRSENA